MKNNIIHNPKALAAAYITALMLPVLILAYTEKNPLWETWQAYCSRWAHTRLSPRWHAVRV